MTVSVRIPHGLAWTVGGRDRVEVEGSTVGEVWDNLRATYPDLMWRLSDGPDRPSFWVRVTIDGRSAEHPTRLDTPLTDGAEIAIHILPGSGVAAGAASGKPPPAAGCGASRG
jgi:molybdopterin converting factor small subunit